MTTSVKNDVIIELKNWWVDNADYWTGLYCEWGESYIPRSFCEKCGEIGANITHGYGFCECGTGFTRFNYMMFNNIQYHHITTQMMFKSHEEYEILYEELLMKSQEWQKKTKYEKDYRACDPKKNRKSHRVAYMRAG